MNTLAIPYPENPVNVDNLASIPLLEAQGFVGPDVDLEESLFEYGLAWCELPDGETLFVYRHPTLSKRFDRCTLKTDLDPLKEWDWADWGKLRDFVGHSAFQDGYVLPLVVQSLVSYYGTEEVFGSSYWEGFAISKA